MPFDIMRAAQVEKVSSGDVSNHNLVAKLPRSTMSHTNSANDQYLHAAEMIFSLKYVQQASVIQISRYCKANFRQTCP
jgi:hypothetical protein